MEGCMEPACRSSYAPPTSRLAAGAFVAAAIIVAGWLAGCGGGGGSSAAPPAEPVPPSPSPPPPPPQQTALRFADVTERAGIAFQHGYAAPTVGSEPEVFGGGAAAGDYDGDGLVDEAS